MTQLARHIKPNLKQELQLRTNDPLNAYFKTNFILFSKLDLEFLQFFQKLCKLMSYNFGSENTVLEPA